MSEKKASLWGSALSNGDMINVFRPGMLVHGTMNRNNALIGVVREVLPKINKVMVAWNGGSISQHDPDEITPEEHQSPIVKDAMQPIQFEGRRMPNQDANKVLTASYDNEYESLTSRRASIPYEEIDFLGESKTAASFQGTMVPAKFIGDREIHHAEVGGDVNGLSCHIVKTKDGNEKHIYNTVAGDELASRLHHVAMDFNTPKPLISEFLTWLQHTTGGLPVQNTKQASDDLSFENLTSRRTATLWASPPKVNETYQEYITDDCGLCPQCKQIVPFGCSCCPCCRQDAPPELLKIASRRNDLVEISSAVLKA